MKIDSFYLAQLRTVNTIRKDIDWPWFSNKTYITSHRTDEAVVYKKMDSFYDLYTDKKYLMEHETKSSGDVFVDTRSLVSLRMFLEARGKDVKDNISKFKVKRMVYKIKI